MFRDVQGLLFTEDGVPADLVRAGEPRLRRSGWAAGHARVEEPARVRTPLLRRLLRPATA